MRTPVDQWLDALREADERETLAFLHARITEGVKHKGNWPGPDSVVWETAVGISAAETLELLLHLADTHAWAWDQVFARFHGLRGQGKPLPPALTAWALGNFERAEWKPVPFGWRNTFVRTGRMPSPLTLTLPRPNDTTAYGERDFWVWVTYRYLRAKGRTRETALVFLTSWNRTLTRTQYVPRTGPVRKRPGARRGLSLRTIEQIVNQWERARPDRQLAELQKKIQKKTSVIPAL